MQLFYKKKKIKDTSRKLLQIKDGFNTVAQIILINTKNVARNYFNLLIYKVFICVPIVLIYL